MKHFKEFREKVKTLAPPGYRVNFAPDICSDGYRLQLTHLESEEWSQVLLGGFYFDEPGWDLMAMFKEEVADLQEEVRGQIDAHMASLMPSRQEMEDAPIMHPSDWVEAGAPKSGTMLRTLLAAEMDQKVSEARHRENQRMLRAMSATVEEKCKAIALLQDQQAQPVFATEYEGEWVEADTSWFCPRCNGKIQGVKCEECGYPGLKTIAGSCRHAELYQIKDGPDAGQLGCLEPNCKARFESPGGFQGKIIRGPDDHHGGASVENSFDFEVNPGLFVVAGIQWGGEFNVRAVRPLNDAAKPPPEGYGFRCT